MESGIYNNRTSRFLELSRHTMTGSRRRKMIQNVSSFPGWCLHLAHLLSRLTINGVKFSFMVYKGPIKCCLTADISIWHKKKSTLIPLMMCLFQLGDHYQEMLPFKPIKKSARLLSELFLQLFIILRFTSQTANTCFHKNDTARVLSRCYGLTSNVFTAFLTSQHQY